MVTFQCVKWETTSAEEHTHIYIHGLTADNQRVSVLIPDFKPYIYLELDPEVKWTETKVDLVRAYLKARMKKQYAVKNKLVERTKNYYYKKGKFLWLAFNNVNDIRYLDNITKNSPLTIRGLGKVTLAVHEKSASPILQLFAMRKLKPSGWITATQTTKAALLEEYSDSHSTADIQIVSSYNGISQSAPGNVPDPLVLSYDIECISGDSSGDTFPNAHNPNDIIICICATIARSRDPETQWRTVALVNETCGKECPDTIDNSEVLHFKNEKDLLLGWSKFVTHTNPDVITGYNTLSFDDNYIMERAKHLGIFAQFTKLGRVLSRSATCTERKWTSSAYGAQCFHYLEIPGVLHVDMFPVIQKDYTTLQSYTLDAVSEHFLGDHKVNLSAKDMIHKWHNGDSSDMIETVHYCNKDTILPLKLMQKMNTWLGLIEMSNVMMVQIFDLVTRGQQIRVYSQLYTRAFEMNIVCLEKWADYKPSDEEKEFVGAVVQDPQVGYWENVATYDFKSLYPTTIIAYNLCFSTFIPPDEPANDGDYHLLEWSDHSYCEHDTTVRKTKAKGLRICKSHSYRFWKAEVKKGIVPMLLQDLLDARANSKTELKTLERSMGTLQTPEEKAQAELQAIVLDKRQNSYKIAANSVYGGFGSDYSFVPFYPAAASTTAMGRRSIHQAITFAKEYRPDCTLVYGDTDSCMLHFSNVKDLAECFKICEDLEHAINKIFPKPMYLELEKIYSKYFLLSKKRYIGYIVNRKNEITSIDKKGVVLKRRDNCAMLRKIYHHLIEMIMEKQPLWRVYGYLHVEIDHLLTGNVTVDDLVITKSLKAEYKSTNLPHVVVSEKMKGRGKYVTVGTRIRYIFIETENTDDPQYMKAEDPDWYHESETRLKIDYLYYFEKQLLKPIDEALQVKYGKENVLKNLHKLLKRGCIRTAKDYFTPKFKIVEA